MLNVILEDIMCDHPIKVKENVNVGSVAHLLYRYRINGILVVKEDDENSLIGILTTTDLLKLLDVILSERIQRIHGLEEIATLTAGEIATKDIATLQKDDKITKAIAIMHKKSIHTIPVFDKDKLVGVVGRHDLLNAALAG